MSEIVIVAQCHQRFLDAFYYFIFPCFVDFSKSSAPRMSPETVQCTSCAVYLSRRRRSLWLDDFWRMLDLISISTMRTSSHRCTSPFRRTITSRLWSSWKPSLNANVSQRRLLRTSWTSSQISFSGLWS